MPARPTASNRTATNTTRRRRIPVPAFQEPLIAEKRQASPPEPPEPESAEERPTEYNGIPVEREEPLPSPLPKAQPFRISRLYLANGVIAYACRDCLFTADGRGEVMVHRNAAHGSRYGKKRSQVILAKDPTVEEFVLPPRKEGPAPDTLLEMTIGEFLAVAPTIKALGDHLEQLETEKNDLQRQLAEVRIDRSTQHKIDVYESHRQEILDLRLTVQKQANYEQIREELYELRAWKRKITHKLSQLGFKLDEE